MRHGKRGPDGQNMETEKKKHQTVYTIVHVTGSVHLLFIYSVYNVYTIPSLHIKRIFKRHSSCDMNRSFLTMNSSWYLLTLEILQVFNQ